MAINRDSFELFCWAKKHSSKEWDHVLTLGRQSVILHPWEVKDWSKRAASKGPFDRFTGRADDASAGEELLSQLGSKNVHTMDFSPYEGATVIHNLNDPVPHHHHLKYDVVFDGGTLEHVFDYPTALRNAMSMVTPGGWFLASTPSNMWCGHGFYQFSPEIFRSVMSESNGFSLELMAFALEGYHKEYWICDLSQNHAGKRQGIHAKRPASLLIAARRINNSLPDKLTTQQTDYVSRWEGTAVSDRQATKKKSIKLTSLLPWSIRGRLRLWCSNLRLQQKFQGGLKYSDSLI